MDDTGFTILSEIKDSTKFRHSNEVKYLHNMLSKFGCQTKICLYVEKFVKSSALENMKKHIKKMHPELIPDEPSIQQKISNK